VGPSWRQESYVPEEARVVLGGPGGCRVCLRCEIDDSVARAYGVVPVRSIAAAYRLTLTGLEYDGTCLVGSCTDRATQLAK
jgi:hypothetical protein